MPPEEATNKVFWYSYWGVVIGSTLPMLLGAVVGILFADDQIGGISTATKGFSVVVMLVFALGIMDTNVPERLRRRALHHHRGPELQEQVVPGRPGARRSSPPSSSPSAWCWR